MIKVLLPLIWCLAVGLAPAAQPDGDLPAAADPQEQLVREKRHFLQCLSYVYSPALWISHNGSLFFTIRSEEQANQLEAMRASRDRYVALTNRQKRYEMAAKGLVASGIDATSQRKLLLPYSETNHNLTPTLGRAVLSLPTYKVLQQLPERDALIQDESGRVCFVMGFGRAADDAACTNGLLVKEGEKTYKTQTGGQNTVEAFTSVGLNASEKALLNRVAAGFQKLAAAEQVVVVPAQAREEFELIKARATDSNPYLQFQVAKAYLEGKGTQKDETEGMEWMRRAARSGSGDAKRFLNSQTKTGQ